MVSDAIVKVDLRSGDDEWAAKESAKRGSLPGVVIGGLGGVFVAKALMNIFGVEDPSVLLHAQSAGAAFGAFVGYYVGKTAGYHQYSQSIMREFNSEYNSKREEWIKQLLNTRLPQNL